MRDNKYDEKSGHIKFIKVNKPRFGIGSYLMILVCYLYYIYEKKITIELDDDSDLSRKGSIYEKLGCEYVNEYPFPEMECETPTILNKYKDFYNKYRDKGFFKTSHIVGSFLTSDKSKLYKISITSRKRKRENGMGKKQKKRKNKIKQQTKNKNKRKQKETKIKRKGNKKKQKETKKNKN